MDNISITIKKLSHAIQNTPKSIPKDIVDRMLNYDRKEKELCPTCINDNNGRYSSVCQTCYDFSNYVKK